MWPRVDGYRSLELGAPGEQRSRLNGLVLHGSKRAAAGIRVEYEDEGESVEHVGEVLVLLDSGRQEIGRLLVTGVIECGFDEVPWDFAEAEGEGFTSIEDWRGRHRRVWEGEGHVVRAETPIVCISFELLTLGCAPTPSASD
jgi:uncharacterized protein YhfF